MKEIIAIACIYLERIAFAIVGLLACIYQEVWWAILMGIMLFIVSMGTSVKIKSK